MGFRKQKKSKPGGINKPVVLSRKEQRKLLRKEKKNKKVEYLANRAQRRSLKNKFNKNQEAVKSKETHNKLEFTTNSSVDQEKRYKTGGVSKERKIFKNKNSSDGKDYSKLSVEQLREQEHERKLKKDMALQRKKQLKDANKEEDKTIKKLEKQLKLDKKKGVHKSFVSSGLDYILDVCDPDKIKSAAIREQSLMDSGSEFEEDMALITGNEAGKKVKSGKSKRKESEKGKPAEDSDDTQSDGFSDLEGSDDGDESLCSGENNSESEEGNITDSMATEESDDNDLPKGGRNLSSKEGENKKSGKRVTFSGVPDREESVEESPPKKKLKKLENTSCTEDEDDMSDEEMSGEGDDVDSNEEFEDYPSDEDMSGDEVGGGEDSGGIKEGNWEDIYGRLRDRHGNVIEESKGKYVPPHLRLGSDMSDKKKEELARLKKELKGLLNRLAENNMHSISNQVDELYMKNSRFNMNETILNLTMESLVSPVPTPERMVMEHAMLIAILHANVGTEVGAYMLQNMVKRFNEIHSSDGNPIENKTLDNLLLVICHLYTFKVFNCCLLYDLMSKLCDRFGEKEIDLVILILRSVGFMLRKDDPVAMKNLLLRVQKLASAQSQASNQNSRVKFMLDVLLTIKNNNMAKLPQYDPTLSEHLKKVLKTMLRKGNYVTELKISLEDILKADERGKWWVVGSAWTGSASPAAEPKGNPLPALGQLSQEVLELAKKQRMNTANRKNIFCILMTAEDYLDAFEKLLKLGLKGQPEQEIVHVLLHCLLQEKDYNPYYYHIASQLCTSNRRHQLTIQFSVWDRIKELSSMKPNQITNLAKFLGHLFLDKSLPISVLKVLHFAEMDKPCLRLLRQVLLTVLTGAKESAESEAVFARVSRSESLSDFRESLRLFLNHFILKNLKEEGLRERALLADRALTSDSKAIDFSSN